MNTRRGGPARQKRAHLAIAAVLALMLVPCAAWARALSDEERASLATTVESFVAATREGNFARVAQALPPKVLGDFARRAGATPDQTVALMSKAMQQALQEGDIKIELFGMDLGNADHNELASGAPYLLIPTQTIIAVGGRRFREGSHTLALLDGGKWFLLRTDAPQLHILVDVYPEFAGVEFPSGSIEASNP